MTEMLCSETPYLISRDCKVQSCVDTHFDEWSQLCGIFPAHSLFVLFLFNFPVILFLQALHSLRSENPPLDRSERLHYLVRNPGHLHLETLELIDTGQRVGT
jgi:hypothetical protein